MSANNIRKIPCRALHIGFSGTRKGMTDIQIKNVTYILKTHTRAQFIEQGALKNWFHHGDCVGADAQAHDIAKKLGLIIKIHPAYIEDYRAHCDPGSLGIVLPAKAYLQRNDDIVNQTSILIGAPAHSPSRTRTSGTWYTINKARKAGKLTIAILPDGEVVRQEMMEDLFK